MGLATPAAIMAGVNAAARRGILIRDGAALEKSGRITAVLFDKTGTLTEGKLAVAAVESTEAGRALTGGLVGRDSVEPQFERSEASAASILGSDMAGQETRFARASFVGKWGSTESHPT